MQRHGKYSFTKRSDDKLLEVETLKERKQERRDSLDTCCQTPSDWKEPTIYNINNLQDASTEKSTKNSRKKNPTSFRVIDESRPIEEQAIGRNRQSMTLITYFKIKSRKTSRKENSTLLTDKWYKSNDQAISNYRNNEGCLKKTW